MKLTLLLLAVLCLSACEKNPVSTHATDNTEIAVSKLFTHEDCTVYRFEDDGWDHYYVVCGGSHTASVTDKYGCGKGCVRQDEIPTIVK